MEKGWERRRDLKRRVEGSEAKWIAKNIKLKTLSKMEGNMKVKEAVNLLEFRKWNIERKKESRERKEKKERES